MSAARARVHAMFPLDENAEQELDQRLDAHRAEILADVEARLAAMASEADQLTEVMETADDTSSPTMYAQYTGLRRARDEVRRIAAGEKATAVAAPATPDFFQPDRTYRKNGWRFRCDAISPHPETGTRSAMGWCRHDGPDSRWTVSCMDPWDWDCGGWNDTTEEVARG